MKEPISKGYPPSPCCKKNTLINETVFDALGFRRVRTAVLICGECGQQVLP